MKLDSKRTPDFSGWATKENILCSDGATIGTGAFAHQDGVRVPFVWQHGHSNVENILGHAELSNKPGGVWADVYLNSTNKARHAKETVASGDITQMSIWANRLRRQGSRVVHGVIREVSLVITGANSEARIDPLTIRHSDGFEEESDDEAIIVIGESFVYNSDTKLAHADSTQEFAENEATVADVVDGMTETQQLVLNYLINAAVESAAHSALEQTEQEQLMNYSPFEDGLDTDVLSHEDMASIFADAQSRGSFKDAVTAFAEEHLAHGINDVESLFPDPKELNSPPEWVTPDQSWVPSVFDAASKSPMSRIRTSFAHLTFDEARAQGFVKGNLKKDQYFALSRRSSSPTTVYKRQKLDRDDILDIRDFDVVQWIRREMRGMLVAEIARQILIGDGRDIDDPDRIDPEKLRPILTDDPFFTVPVSVPHDPETDNVSLVIDALIAARVRCKGTGLPTLFTTQEFITRCKLLKDTNGRRIYTSDAEVAAEIGVARLVAVEPLETMPDVIGIMVNMADYRIGADSGGEITNFDNFDIDYNTYKYLSETRVSGMLTKPYSAVVVRRVEGASVLVHLLPPIQDKTTWVITIPEITGVLWTDADGNVVETGGLALEPDTNVRLIASPAEGYHFKPDAVTQWTFLRPRDS